MTRLYAWSQGLIPAKASAMWCAVRSRCRQARRRFLCAVGYAEQVFGRPLRLAYPDPPHLGKARLYGITRLRLQG